MPSTYSDLTVHVVFSTKDRKGVIKEEWQARLHAYLASTAKGLGTVPLAVGGVTDHVHLLLGLSPDQRISDLVRELKKASTLWFREQSGQPGFGWQAGYAVFSVSTAAKPSTVAYILHQKEHHQTWSSQDELRSLLEEAGIEIDERCFV